MAACVMPGPGGLCIGSCKHLDCAALRKLLNALCTICKKSIETGQRYYGTKNSELRHADCAEDS